MEKKDPQDLPTQDLPHGLHLPLVDYLPSQARKVVVLMVGSTVLTIGVALIVLPGPAFIVIPIGIAILAGEYVWARRWLRRIHQMVDGIKEMSGRLMDHNEKDDAKKSK